MLNAPHCWLSVIAALCVGSRDRNLTITPLLIQPGTTELTLVPPPTAVPDVTLHIVNKLVAALYRHACGLRESTSPKLAQKLSSAEGGQPDQHQPLTSVVQQNENECRHQQQQATGRLMIRVHSS